MSDDPRKLLKIFGVTVTEFEAEAQRLTEAAERLAASGSHDELAALLAAVARSCRDLDARWMDVTRHVFAAKERLLASVGEAAARAGGPGDPGAAH